MIYFFILKISMKIIFSDIIWIRTQTTKLSPQ